MSRPIPRGLLYALFALSGFAGLIYESIWSHYLKLMLGHAAYAQTLVLVIFMGGMAIGSWLTGRLSRRVARPLLWYAIVEAILGAAALLFDGVFRTVQAWLFDSVVVNLDSGLAIDIAKWSVAAALTLPQAIMLGATFPLMSTGLLRMHPGVPGQALSWLYFTNSLGASFGVLASGFYLVGAVGLPGTIMVAGIVNFTLAAIVYLAERDVGPVAPLAVEERKDAGSVSGIAVAAMLWTAALTGAASFMYEIGWIRMLSLVLGSATHSFELMLSAFILGLALGSFYIRKRIDASADPLRLLGWIQVVMALLALLSLPLYMQSFDAMAGVLKALARNYQGYVGFNLFSHLVCLALMLPVTFCAGMTLPLITAALLRAGRGEGSIGRVYAANTLGAIAGVLLAVHVVMPLLGLRMVVVVGAAIDLVLGVWLLTRGRTALPGRARLVLAGALVLALGLSLFTELDPRRTSSGVFRHGAARSSGAVIFHRDGKTATVDVKDGGDGAISISTNGKVDAAMSPKGVTLDDFTMILAAALPMAMEPDAKQVGVIGMGSGRSTHAFLLNQKLERVDTVEIEPAMVEGARLFGDLVKLAYTDPRSHITIDDAKTYFARNQRRYDIIISEPSNPWVSGVATLFSVEFYRQIKRYMEPEGLFVQWLQLYEIDVPVLSTVFKALQTEFPDYRVYYTDANNILIIASADRKVPPPGDWLLSEPGLGPLLKQLQIVKLADFDQRLLGTSATLRPFFGSYPWPANSDYFPVLDQNAASRRFMRSTAADLAALYPYSTRLESATPLAAPTEEVPGLAVTGAVVQVGLIREYYAQAGSRSLPKGMEAIVIDMLNALRLDRDDCEAASLRLVWLMSLKRLIGNYGPYLDPATGARIVAQAEASPCHAAMDAEMRDWLEFLRAQTSRDWPRLLAVTQKLLPGVNPKAPEAGFLLAEGTLAALKSGGEPAVRQFLKQFEQFPRTGAAQRYLMANTR